MSGHGGYSGMGKVGGGGRVKILAGDEIDKSVKDRIKNALNNIMKQFPLSKDEFSGIVQSLKNRYGYTLDEFPYEEFEKLPYAERTMYDGTAAATNSRIYVNEDFIGHSRWSVSEAEKENISKRANGKITETSMGGAVEDVMAHEYGHLMFDALRKTKNGRSYQQALYNYYNGNREKIERDLGRYSVSNISEMLPEAVAQSLSSHQTQTSKDIINIFRQSYKDLKNGVLPPEDLYAPSLGRKRRKAP